MWASPERIQTYHQSYANWNAQATALWPEQIPIYFQLISYWKGKDSDASEAAQSRFWMMFKEKS